VQRVAEGQFPQRRSGPQVAQVVEPGEVLETQSGQARVAGQIPQPGHSLVPVEPGQAEPGQIFQWAEVGDPRALSELDGLELRAVPGNQVLERCLVQPADHQGRRVRVPGQDVEFGLADAAAACLGRDKLHQPARIRVIPAVKIGQASRLRLHIPEAVIIFCHEKEVFHHVPGLRPSSTR
jgi:hypothetical protein